MNDESSNKSYILYEIQSQIFRIDKYVKILQVFKLRAVHTYDV